MKRAGLIVCTAVSLAVFIAAEIVFAVLGGLMESQRAADRWSAGEPFAQLSVYRVANQCFSYSEIYNLRNQIDAALTQSSLEGEWRDAYSYKTSASATGDHASTTADVYAFGGSFFLFHNFKLTDGQYISDDDLSRDRVVMTQKLAWKLFGATQVAGMKAEINGRTYIVAGVVDEESDPFTKAAGGVGECLFMFYDCLSSYEESNISTYEALLPEPVGGYALDTVKNLTTGVIVQNSKRFSVSRVFKVMEDFGKRSMNTEGIIFPYWENAARGCEDWLALTLLVAIASAILPLIYGLAWAVKGYKALRRETGRRVAKWKLR